MWIRITNIVKIPVLPEKSPNSMKSLSKSNYILHKTRNSNLKVMWTHTPPPLRTTTETP
jgi:hypothetical protein